MRVRPMTQTTNNENDHGYAWARRPGTSTDQQQPTVAPEAAGDSDAQPTVERPAEPPVERPAQPPAEPPTGRANPFDRGTYGYPAAPTGGHPGAYPYAPPAPQPPTQPSTQPTYAGQPTY